MGIGTAAGPGAAQGPHGEEDGDATGVAIKRPGTTATERQPTDDKGTGNVLLAGCLFCGSGGGTRHALDSSLTTRQHKAMATLNPQALDALLASVGGDQERARKYFELSWQRHVVFLEQKGFESPEDLIDAVFNRAAQEVSRGRVSRENLATHLLADVLQIAFPRETQVLPAEPLFTTSPAPLDGLRSHLQARFPVLYAQVLEPTLADLREEHSAALANGRPLKARCVLLQGCGALAAAAVCQLGFSLLDRIAALWQARSPK